MTKKQDANKRVTDRLLGEFFAFGRYGHVRKDGHLIWRQPKTDVLHRVLIKTYKNKSALATRAHVDHYSLHLPRIPTGEAGAMVGKVDIASKKVEFTFLDKEVSGTREMENFAKWLVAIAEAETDEARMAEVETCPFTLENKIDPSYLWTAAAASVFDYSAKR